MKTFYKAVACVLKDLKTEPKILCFVHPPPKEDFQIPQTNEEMASLEKWIHEYSFIYPNGRIMHIDQGEGTPALVPRLQSISNDKRKYIF